MYFDFSLHISHDEFLRVYQGRARYVIVTDDTGRRVQLPASRFLPFVSTLGVRGRFRLITDDDHKFVSLERLS
jgi:hypothetical protein